MAEDHVDFNQPHIWECKECKTKWHGLPRYGCWYCEPDRAPEWFKKDSKWATGLNPSVLEQTKPKQSSSPITDMHKRRMKATSDIVDEIAQSRGLSGELKDYKDDVCNLLVLAVRELVRANEIAEESRLRLIDIFLNVKKDAI